MNITKNSHPFVQEKGQELKIKLHFENVQSNAEKVLTELQSGILNDMSSKIVDKFRCIDTQLSDNRQKSTNNVTMMSVNADQTKAKPDRRMSNLGSVAQNRKDSIANLEFMRNR